MIAHVAGVPVEELLPLLGGTGAALAVTRVWMTEHLRGGRRAARSRD